MLTFSFRQNDCKNWSWWPISATVLCPTLSKTRTDIRIVSSHACYHFVRNLIYYSLYYSNKNCWNFYVDSPSKYSYILSMFFLCQNFNIELASKLPTGVASNTFATVWYQALIGIQFSQSIISHIFTTPLQNIILIVSCKNSSTLFFFQFFSNIHWLYRFDKNNWQIYIYL